MLGVGEIKGVPTGWTGGSPWLRRRADNASLAGAPPDAAPPSACSPHACMWSMSSPTPLILLLGGRHTPSMVACGRVCTCASGVETARAPRDGVRIRREAVPSSNTVQLTRTQAHTRGQGRRRVGLRAARTAMRRSCAHTAGRL
ncbi:hypothetical protein EON67_07230 [archaeon]|nr:MAG: hypothetical protein EON67_07230 [archaeon]